MVLPNSFSKSLQNLPEMLNGFVKWSVGVAFWDFNSDNKIDAMVGNFLAFDPAYVSPTTPDMMPHPSEYKGQASMLYQQQSDGRFIDVTKKYELYFPDSKCMGLTIYDYDNDGDLDIFQGNDHQLNFLFRNDNLRFIDVAVPSGVAANSRGVPTGSMHGSIGDIDNDGLIDLFVTDLRYGALYRNIGNGLFEDITEKSGVAGTFAGKGAWAAALFDYDNDGDLDIIVSHIDLQATATLLRNDLANSNHWLGLKLIGKNGPASAIGARIIVKIGNKNRVYINQWATSYLSNHDSRVHIGLGQDKHIDQIEIFWSNGRKETYNNPPIDRYLTIKQGTGILPE
ncbi:hypothetical protein ES705_48000 [subsurface metagenome]